MKKYHNARLALSLNNQDSNFDSLRDVLHVDDRVFLRTTINPFPREIQKILIDQYLSFDNAFDANTQLRRVAGELSEILPPKLLDFFDATEDDFRFLGKEFAEKCLTISVNLAKEFNKHPDRDRHTLLLAQYDACSDVANTLSIKPAEVDSYHPLHGAIKRMQTSVWWTRRLRKLLIRRREKAMISLNQVNRLKGKYCSDLTLKQRLLQKQRNEDTLDNLVMINELQEELALRDVFEANVSNPVNRRNELMTRMSGFETLSKEFGHMALFITLTCPSKFHKSYARSGQPNPKWNGSTPHESQEYLNTVWSRIRAELNRQSIQQYGFRISEPQHDGTPHWHLLVFIKPKHRDALVDIYTHYALEEDGNENGAKENRITFVDIDPKRGSATGYIAKYVSKNIDGGHLDTDIDGGNADDAAKRVEAWASCWGIRQFQQLGNISVTVWREMRKLKKHQEENEQLNAIYEAADNGRWAEFVTLMGGVFCKRNEQAIRPFYQVVADTDTGEVKQSYFDDLPTFKIKGVQHQGKEIITREHEWRIEQRREKEAA